MFSRAQKASLSADDCAYKMGLGSQCLVAQGRFVFCKEAIRHNGCLVTWLEKAGNTVFRTKSLHDLACAFRRPQKTIQANLQGVDNFKDVEKPCVPVCVAKYIQRNVFHNFNYLCKGWSRLQIAL